MRFGHSALFGLFAASQVLGCAAFEGRGTMDPPAASSTTVLGDLPVETPEPEVPLVRGASVDEAPFTLTASDGTGLTLASMKSNTVIEGPLALTELLLEFDNPEERTLEGRFAITLPEGASVSRFAMQVQNEWQEGEVVEKQRARQSYESFLHQRRDPALLEQGAGNQFSARVFPIPPKARKRVILAYAEVLDDARPFRVRLKGLPKVESLDVRVVEDGAERRISEKSFVPKSDLVLDRGAVARASGVAAGSKVVLRGTVPDASAKADPLGATLVLVDSSAGRSLDLDDELAGVRALVGSLPPDARVAIAAFDQEVSLVYDGPAKSFGDDAIEKISRRGALGATDLASALAWASVFAPKNGLARVVLFGDGVASSGESSVAGLERAASKLGAAGVARTDVIAVGGLRDSAALASIARAGGARSGVVTDVDGGAANVARRLSRRTLGAVALAVPGAKWQSQRTLEGLQPGDDFVVFAELEGAAPKSLAVKLDREEVTIPIRQSESSELVERAHAVARISELERGDAKDEDVRKRIVALSTQHRILSRETAMVVLETDSDYARFGIDRTATLDILGIENDKIVTHKGSHLSLGGKPGTVADAAPPAPPSGGARALPSALGGIGGGAPAPAASAALPAADDPLSARGNMWGDEIGDSFGAGGLGLSGVGAGGGGVGEGGGGRGEGIGLGSIGTVGHGAGTGSGQGFGSGSGRLSGEHRSRPPSVRMGATEVSGRLPPEVIQRIVRQSFGRFRLCYEEGLRTKPDLAGQVSIRFVIGGGGEVKSPSVLSSTMLAPTVERCIARGFSGLSFPQPEGGTVTVVYPILFAPGGDQPSPIDPRPTPVAVDPPSPNGPPAAVSPYEGRFKTVMDALAEKQGDKAMDAALHYRADAPSDVLAYVALGEAAEATGRPRLAARAYGSILDLWSYQVEMKRFAAERLERVASPRALAVAVDAYASANADRADHPSGYRLLAYAALKAGDPKRAFETVEKGLVHRYPDGRFAGVLEVLREDAGILGSAWIAADKSVAADVAKRLEAVGAKLADEPSTRFILSWETDANDVDLHVTDAYGEHASYQHMTLDSGGKLVADVTTGYGPEAFVIPGQAKAFPYRLSADYYSRGVMGFGMGKIEVVRHDGHGKVKLEERPFVIQTQKGRVDLGSVDG